MPTRKPKQSIGAAASFSSLLVMKKRNLCLCCAESNAIVRPHTHLTPGRSALSPVFRGTAWYRTHPFGSQRLQARKGITDPRDNAVPLALLGCRIVNQHAIHEAASKITAVVPDLVFAEAGHDEEARCYPLVHNV